MKQKKTSCFLRHRGITGGFSTVFLLSMVLLFVSCKKDLLPEDDAAAAALVRGGKTQVLVVAAGSSIQAAINAAAEGTVIKIRPGTYHESIVVDKPGITLVGEGKVVIQNGGNAAIGVMVKDGADGFVLKHVTVRGFTERGVEIKDIDGFLLRQIAAIGNGEFGLFAQYSSNGAIEHCEATGHTDTGIFVGESTEVRVLQNKTYGNTIGVETENASQITIEQNHIYDNTAGILCLLVPHPTVTESSNITITKNQVRDNNHPNLQTGTGELEAILPAGIGMLLLGVNNALVQENQVTKHQFTGIALISTTILGLLAGIPPEAFAGIEPNPDGARIIANKLRNNGFAPPAGLPLPGVDLLWDGSGSDNCWSRNLYNTAFPSPLPSCP